jgi:hypothetical protein
MTITLQKTDDFSIFEMNETNRLVGDAKGFAPRKDLLASMKKDGFRASQPISCSTTNNGKLKIFDGHNRFATARFLGIPVYFLAYPPDLAVSPLDYSKGQKRWSYSDTAKAVAQDNADYAEVIQFQETTGILLPSAFSMFHGDVASSGNADKFVRLGTFKIKDRDAPWSVAAITRALGRHCNFSTERSLIYAISKSIHAAGFDVNRMIERIDKAPDLIKRCRTTEDCLDTIYNRNMKSERYYFRIEVERAMKRRSVFSKPSNKAR